VFISQNFKNPLYGKCPLGQTLTNEHAAIANVTLRNYYSHVAIANVTLRKYYRHVAIANVALQNLQV
jgi:hypothetical protein